MNDSDRCDDLNLRSPRFLLACTVEPCPRCAAITPLYALALPPGHLVLEPDGDARDETDAAAWHVASNNALLFHVEFVTGAVRSRLESLASSYRPSAGNGGNDGGESADQRWANHCVHCGATLEDDELLCEPGFAFQPATAEDAARIRLVAVDCPFAAVATGYVHEPTYFDAMG